MNPDTAHQLTENPMIDIQFEPAWKSTVPDWLLVIRATWATPKLMREAAAEIQRRNAEPNAKLIWLAGDPKRHQRLLDAALVAEDQARAA